MLQEKLEMLCELGVSGWFGPDGLLPGRWQICFEHKKLMNGEIGPNTGEQGTVCQYVEKDKLADETLVPLEPALRALGHRGDFAIGVGIDHAGKAWAFEFTARAGWPCFYIQTASHRGDPAAWMAALLDGKDTLRVSYDVAIGVVLAHPRYPYNASPPELVEGNPIRGELGPNFHPASVMVGKGPKMEGGKVVDGPVYMTSGEYVGCATALGKTVERARQKVYATIDGIKFPNKMYRTDIGEKVIEALPALHRHGYARNMN
jgi:phosphoribosylamine--glycine ligase